jgi:hypothetical protein
MGARAAFGRLAQSAAGFFFEGGSVKGDAIVAGFFLSAFGFFASRVLRFCPLAIMVSCAAERSRRSSIPTLPDLHAYHESGHEPPAIGVAAKGPAIWIGCGAGKARNNARSRDAKMPAASLKGKLPAPYLA